MIVKWINKNEIFSRIDYIDPKKSVSFPLANNLTSSVCVFIFRDLSLSNLGY